MILQALCKYYDLLVQDEQCEIPRLGWTSSKISFGLDLSPQGELLRIVDLRNSQGKGKPKARNLLVPEQPGRSGTGSIPYFMSDKSDYILGVKGTQVITRHFAAFRDYHLGLLKNVDSPGASAICAFLKKWQPEQAHELLAEVSGFSQDVIDNASPNFVFMLGQNYIHQDPHVAVAWQKIVAERNARSERGYCLVSGEKDFIAELHPQIQGVKDAQPTGASVVSYNIKAFESYGKKSGYNSPVSISSSFKYATLLNWMLRGGSEQKMYIGDATVVFWADSPSRTYSDFFALFVNPELKKRENDNEESRLADQATEKEIRGVLKALKAQRPARFDNSDLDPDTSFYILGLAPNNARISVRFFLRDSFGGLIAKIDQHYQDLELVGKDLDHPPLWLLLNETVSKSARDKNVSPILAGNLTTAVFTGKIYPLALLAAIILRIRADHEVNMLRAAIVKACLLRKDRLLDNQKLQEVLKVSLNTETTNQAYLLGRLFAVLERIQENAQGDINKTIKATYFSTASASPRAVFPQLVRLAQYHLTKMGDKGRWLDITMGKILDDIALLPANLDLENQGLFILGYYQQRQDFFTKKSDKAIETEITAE